MEPDRYELLDVIGSGGMATVWRARDARLDRLVAIKRPHPAPAGSDTLLRFAREARVAATVSHPNLVAVYDAGTDEQGPYLVMELVDGPSLATATATTATPTIDPAHIGAEVASALAALHAAGIVHGDVKPGNILLAGDRAKLTDFGIARAADDATLTRTGMTFGTPAYAAPETLAHGDRTAAADVYSLGAVLYELSTGERWSAQDGTTRAMPRGAAIAPLTAALSTDPAARPSAAALAAQLRAPIARPPAAATAALPPTTAMAADAPPPIDPAMDRSFDRNDEWSADRPRTTQRTALVLFTIGAVVVAGLVALALRDDEPGSAGTATSGVAISTNPAAATSSPTSEAPPTSAASAPATEASPTTVATTSPPTTAPPTTSPATTVPPDPAAAIADELVGRVDAATPDQVKPKEAKDIVQRIDEAIRAADEGRDEEVEKRLREAAEKIDEHVAGDETRAAMRSLLVDLADELGVDPDVVTDPFDEQGDGDD